MSNIIFTSKIHMKLSYEKNGKNEGQKKNQLVPMFSYLLSAASTDPNC